MGWKQDPRLNLALRRSPLLQIEIAIAPDDKYTKANVYKNDYTLIVPYTTNNEHTSMKSSRQLLLNARMPITLTKYAQ